MPLERPIWANARSWRLRKLPRRSSYESAGKMAVCRGFPAGWRARDYHLSHDWLASVYRAEGAPEPLTSPVITGVDSPDQVRMGSRLANLAGCIDCHTPQIKGENLPGLEFAGGGVFLGPWPTVASANITPDASGISYYDETLFLQVMRTGYVKARPLSPVMPISVYKNLTDADLKAIFAFLRTVKPVKHQVDNSEPPTDCRVCRQKHGAGVRN
jgi:hypothetical protein